MPKVNKKVGQKRKKRTAQGAASYERWRRACASGSSTSSRVEEGVTMDLELPPPARPPPPLVAARPQMMLSPLQRRDLNANFDCCESQGSISTLSGDTLRQPPIARAQMVDETEHLKVRLESLLDNLISGVGLQRQFLEEILAGPKYNQASGGASVGSSLSSRTPDPRTRINRLRMAEATPLDVDAFARKPSGEERKTAQAKKSAKSKAVRELQLTLDKIGNEPQQLLALIGLLGRSKNKRVAAGVLNAFSDREEDNAARQCARQIRTLLEHIEKRRSRDSRSYRHAVFTSVAPITSFDGKAIGVPLANLHRLLGGRSTQFYKRMKEGMKKRQEIFAGDHTVSLLDPFQRKKGSSIFTNEMIVELHKWIFSRCDLVVASPNYNDSVMAKDYATGTKKRFQKHYYRGSIRELHNELIKPEEEGGFPGARSPEDGRVILGDSTLRALLPRQLRPLTDSQKQMCGCDICIMSREMISTLKGWRTKRLSDMEAAWREPGLNPIDKVNRKYRWSQYRLQAFKPDGSHRFGDIKEVLDSMTCERVGTTGLHCMSCALGRCLQCPTLAIPELEKDRSTTAPQISFHEYLYYSRCTQHGTIPGAATKCPVCFQLNADWNEEEHQEDEKPPRMGKVSRKLELTRQRKTIGDFVDNSLLPMLAKARYHFLHVALLGKHWCVRQRQETYKTIAGSALIQRDYADHLAAEFTNEIQSTHFGNHFSVSMEGVTVRNLLPNTAAPTESFTYRCFVSDDGKQDSRSTHANSDRLIATLRGQGLLPSPNSVLLELADGCAKQYRSANVVYLLSMLAIKYKLRISRMISAPHHGKGECDLQGGVDKNYIRMHMRSVMIPEVSSQEKWLMPHTVNPDGSRASMAERVCSLLNESARSDGLKGHSKHAKRERERRIQQRFYHCMHHDNNTTDLSANCALPISNTDFEWIPGSFQTGEYNGVRGHYKLMADFNLGHNCIAVRRIPCYCQFCRSRLLLPWSPDRPVNEQPRYTTHPNCELRDVLGDYNEWKIVRVRAKKGWDQSDYQEIYQDILQEYDTAVMSSIQVGGFGAIFVDDDKRHAPDGYYLVRWTGELYTLQEDTIDQDVELQAGTLVCPGTYWNILRGASRWFTPPTGNPEEFLFRIRYVVDASVHMEDLSDTARLPNSWRPQRKATVAALGPKRVVQEAHSEIRAEIARRALLDYEETQQEEQAAIDETEEADGPGDDAVNDNSDGSDAESSDDENDA